MNKSELIGSVASRSGLTKADASRALEAFMEATTEALVRGDQLVIPGFVAFSTSNRSARTGRNPSTGAEIKIPAKRVVKFSAGKKLKEAVQG